MIYSSRLKKLLELCLQRDEYVKVDVLAQELHISTRTVFREIKDVDQDLKEYGLRLDSKPGKGLKILGDPLQKEALLEELQVQGIQYLNKEERQNLLIFELLRNEACEKLIHYANLFQVSEATISNDLDTIEPWLSSHELILNRKPGYGIEVVGKETALRLAMTQLLNQKLMDKEAFEQINYLDSQTLLQEIFLTNGDGIMKLLNQDILTRILDVFTTYQHELMLDRYAQISYIGLIIHLVIAVDRIIKKEQINDHQQVIDMVKEDPSFAQAKQMAEYLECEFDIDIPEVESAFIALHIKGAKMTKISYDEKQEDGTSVQTLIEAMLDSYDDSIALYLKQDEELYHGLLTHLGPTLTRLQNHLPIYNPLLKQIKVEYADLFHQTKQACVCIEHLIGCDVSEDEVGFVTMHVGAAVERAKHGVVKKRVVSIGVVCASGIGVSALLSARIQKAFPAAVHIEVLSMDDILQNLAERCEFLVSTFAIEVESKEVLLVTPLLNEADIANIELALRKAREHTPIQQEVRSQSYWEQLKQIQQMTTHACSMLEGIRTYELDANSDVSDMISYVAQQVTSTPEEQDIVIEDLKRREQLGSIMMKEERFALLHAKSQGVTNSVIALLYPKKETLFHLEEEIAFVVVLLTPKTKDRIPQELLSVFSRSIMEQPSFYEAILQRNITDVKEFYSLYCLTYVIEQQGDEE